MLTILIRSSLDSSFARGLELFDRGEYYEAHEVLEDVWRAMAGADKRFVQGLVQLAVGLHHYSTGNRAGARSVLARGCRNLAHYPGNHCGLDLKGVRDTVIAWCEALDHGAAPPPPPRLGAADGGGRIVRPHASTDDR